MTTRILLVTFFFIINNLISGQTQKIIQSDDNAFVMEIKFDDSVTLIDTVIEGGTYTKVRFKGQSLFLPGEPELPYHRIPIALSYHSLPKLSVVEEEYDTKRNKMVIPVTDEEGEFEEFNFDQDIYAKNALFPKSTVELSKAFTYRYIRLTNLDIYPVRFNPVKREIEILKKIIVRIDYNNSSYENVTPVADVMTERFITKHVINWEQGLKWTGKRLQHSEKPSGNQNWLDPDKEWFKIFVTEKNIYRISYPYLEALGFLDGTSIPSDKIQIFDRDGEVPVDINDGGDGLFNGADFLQFVGFPPPASENATTNLYNIRNIYWLTTQGEEGLRYQKQSGYPGAYTKHFKKVIKTDHYEVDSLFERLGLAPDGERDYWLWGKAKGALGSKTQKFRTRFEVFENKNDDEHNVTLRAKFHGMTRLECSPDHRAQVLLTGQYLGTAEWDAQTETVYEKTFYVSGDSIHIWSDGNYFEVELDGYVCEGHYSNDEIRVNWFEFDYWRDNRIGTNHYFYKSPPGETGILKYECWQYWQDSAIVYIPQKNVMLDSIQITGNQWGTIYLSDTVDERTEYFLAAPDYYFWPDSVARFQHENLKNTDNGADYIVITHPKFIDQANELVQYRNENLHGFDNPRAMVIEVDDIYNEFSGGLLDPDAINEFCRYAFENWQAPAPSYIALLGDMSWDYKKNLTTSLPNFIPSLPYHSKRYGLAFSDNNFVAVSGDDIIPDIAIGRISCETISQAEILVNKIINYPVDYDKMWKQDILLIGAGQNEADEQSYKFNDKSVLLETEYVLPAGYSTSKVFRYPNKPAYVPFQGDGPRIRSEINEGVSLVNFYGHGGGYQWDLVFNDDDIFVLENEDRLPIVSSVTCYTAHYDNQEAFGEIFNRVANRGCIGFWGNTGLTIWGYGLVLSESLFRALFLDENYVIGDAINYSKITIAGNNPNVYDNDHIALFTYLGDPAIKLAIPEKPDFRIKSAYIDLSPERPLVTDSMFIKIKFDNIGRAFPDDTVSLSYSIVMEDTTYQFPEKRFTSFNHVDSLLYIWHPDKAGLATLKVAINQDGKLEEMDLSDNSAEVSFTIFDLSKPNIIKPYDGITSSDYSLDFLLTDIGYYIGKELKYYFEINNQNNFDNPIIKSQAISPADGLLEWSMPALNEGVYYWRCRLHDGEKFSDWSDIRTITLTPNPESGYYLGGKQLELLTIDNFSYQDSSHSLVMNTDLLPPRPGEERFIDSIEISYSYDYFKPTSITTDGQYIYYANKAYFNNFEPSPVYKVGTGINSEKGVFYDSIPDFTATIWNSIFYHNGSIYVTTGDAYNLLKVNPETGESSTVYIEEGMLDNSSGKVKNGSHYMTSDGEYVYNLAFVDSLGNDYFTVRFFDPENFWSRPRQDLLTGSSTWGAIFSGYFVASGYIYLYEKDFNGAMRRIRLSDGVFEEEWFVWLPMPGFHGWCYDPINDLVYSSIAVPGNEPEIYQFTGQYKEESGSILSPKIGPAISWNYVQYDLDLTGYNGEYERFLLGLNSTTNEWDTLKNPLTPLHSIQNVDAEEYPYIRARYNFIDSSSGVTRPPSFSKLKVAYNSLPEVVLRDNQFIFAPDSILRGFPMTMSYTLENVGYSKADSLRVDFFFNSSDSIAFSDVISIDKDSSVTLSYEYDTTPYIFENAVKSVAILPGKEFYTFNNIAQNSFFVARDSIKPQFNVTFDGAEILNGDLVSANPEIVMTLTDNGPLPLDTANFNITHGIRLLSFTRDSLDYTYTPYPNSTAMVTWRPKLFDGTHNLDIYTTDASGNPSDTVAYRVNFMVDNENTFRDFYNYPNPFSDDTWFTFTLTGSELPEEMNIRIYTVAGRLIKEIEVPVSDLKIQLLNKIYWDGKDQDGDDIANGVYLCKVRTKYNGQYKTEIKKIARVR